MNNSNHTHDQIKYQQALKRVKRIKGFYTHLIVYVVINTMLIIVNYDHADVNYHFWRYQTFNTPFFWGIGLFIHGLSVFLPGMVLGKNWEEKKIKELMDKEKNNKWE